MGIRLIILLALLVGVLYCLHLLVKDYQALTAGRILRFLFKRDVNSQNYSKPNVRWKKILQFDPIQCARLLYCDIGARPAENQVRRGFAFMLTLEPREEDKSAQEEFIRAYNFGHRLGIEQCKNHYYMCPFNPSLLFQLVQYLLRNPYPDIPEPSL
ncbi:uncharacterized protein LOC126368291 [Pectinophora gossypiella]|uniref:uncharacterized protein LOC126368291 n=1 Tax=Pectinophora gossypiella TaxID=13191 RepID=UPI00214E7E41|nr:uncharacterized protein LOC126368291 [Pectinophora gossypiella]